MSLQLGILADKGRAGTQTPCRRVKELLQATQFRYWSYAVHPEIVFTQIDPTRS